MSRETISTGRVAGSTIPPLALVLEASGPLLTGYAAAQRKEILRSAMVAGAEWWIGHYLPLRFTKYARARLGYHIKSGHIKRKKYYGAPDPLVWTGETRETVLRQVNTKPGGSAEAPYVDVRMGRFGVRAAVVFRVLSTILDSEMPGVAREVEQELALVLDGVVPLERGRGGRVRAGQSLSLRTNTVSAATLRGRYQQRLRARDAVRIEAADFAADAGIRAEEGRAAAQAALKRTHDKWRRTAGGSAPTGRGISRTYQGSRRYRHAQAQRRYRAKYRNAVTL